MKTTEESLTKTSKLHDQLKEAHKKLEKDYKASLSHSDDINRNMKLKDEDKKSLEAKLVGLSTERDQWKKECEAKDTTLNNTLRDLMLRDEELKNQKALTEALAQKESKYEQQKAYLQGLANMAAKSQLAAEKETAEERRKASRIANNLHQSEMTAKKLAEEKKNAEDALKMIQNKVEHIRNEYVSHLLAAASSIIVSLFVARVAVCCAVWKRRIRRLICISIR